MTGSRVCARVRTDIDRVAQSMICTFITTKEEDMLQKPGTPAERLIVAADFKPHHIATKYGEDAASVRVSVLALARRLKGTGVYLKVNSALRAYGYELIKEIRSYDLKVFADLKLFDIKETLETDGECLKKWRPELLTVARVAGVTGMQALNAALPYTEVLGVTVLTSLGDTDTREMFACSTDEAVMRLAGVAIEAGIGGIVLAPREAERLRTEFETHMLSINTPGIRPSWAIVQNDDQNPERVMTPAKAIKAGADRIIVGRPITGAADPYDAAMRTIEEIAAVV